MGSTFTKSFIGETNELDRKGIAPDIKHPKAKEIQP